MINIYKIILLGLLTSCTYATEDILNCNQIALYTTKDYICKSYSLKELAINEYYSYKDLIEKKPNEIDRIKKEKSDWINNELNKCEIKNQKKHLLELKKEQFIIKNIKEKIKDEKIIEKEIYLASKIRELSKIEKNKYFYKDKEADKCLNEKYKKRELYYIKEKIDLLTEEKNRNH